VGYSARSTLIRARNRKDINVKARISAFVALLFLAQPAAASNIIGNSALSLAALVGQHAPHLGGGDKKLLRLYLDSHAPRTRAKKIVVTADAVTCRISDVDITAHSCNLTFGGRRVAIRGREAHELYATLVENGVPSSGAAGSLYESLHGLVCTVDPAAVAAKAGGGVSCDFTTAR
jgi:hypothetical protein